MRQHVPWLLVAACLSCAAVRGQDGAAAAPPAAPPTAAGAVSQEPPAVQEHAPATAPATQEQAPATAAGAQDGAPATPASTEEPAAPRLDDAAFRQRLAALAEAHPDLARVESYGTSYAGRPLLALVVQAGDAPLAERQGLLLVGGLDGRRLSDTDVLLALGDALLSGKAGDLRARLGGAALVFVPRANPDGAEALAGASAPAHEQAGNGRRDDADRDGRHDEDAPADVDGDGVLAWMAVPDGEGTWVFDEHDPRALRKARTERGERPTHRLLLEGRDADGDGAENEDDTGGVLPDGNFPHGWREYHAASGAYPLSEPEALALADFVLAHPRLGGVLVIGAQDTLVALPKTAGNAPAGGASPSAPLDGVLADDVSSLKELQRRFAAVGKEQDHEHDVKGEGLTGGSLLAWVYHQAGRWPVALNPWSPPDKLPKAGKDGKRDKDDEDDQAADKKDDENQDDDENGGGDKPGKNDKDGKNGEDDDDKPTSDASSPAPAAVLAWLDTARGGQGFLPWRPFTHDQLGEVQLGGLAPGVPFNAPQPRIDAVVALLAPYVLELLDCLPHLGFEDVRLDGGAGGAYTLEVALVNRGVLPTRTQLASAARIGRPVHVTFTPPADGARLAGEAHVLVDRLAGGGARRVLRWVFTGTPGTRVRVRAEADSVPAVELDLELP